jgi:hypothetical protein
VPYRVRLSEEPLLKSLHHSCCRHWRQPSHAASQNGIAVMPYVVGPNYVLNEPSCVASNRHVLGLVVGPVLS